MNNHHKTLLISQALNQFICDILQHNYLLQTSTSTTSKNCQSLTQSKHSMTGLYQGLDDICDGDRDSDKSSGFSDLRQYTTVTNQ